MDEILSLRTSHSKTFDAGDGQRRLEVSMCRKHYLDGSVWRDVETEWVFEDGFGNKIQKADYHARHFGNTLRFGFAPGVWADYTVPVELTFDGNTASGWIDENTEIRYTATPDGVQKRIILAAPPALGTVYSFGIRLVGCTAEIRENSLVFSDIRGEACGCVPAPWMADAEGREGFAELGFDGETLTVTPDVIFLQTATYPVMIDPTTTFSPSSAADDGKVCRTTLTDSVALYLGNKNGELYSLFVRFPVVPISHGSVINSAYIQYKAGTGIAAQNVYSAMYFNATDNAVAPTTADEFNAKARTVTYVGWIVPPTINETLFESPDIKSLVQEVVDRPGWVSGNAMMLLHRDDISNYGAYREIYAANWFPEYAPKLIIAYTPITSGSSTLNGLGAVSASGVNIEMASSGIAGSGSLSTTAKKYISVSPVLSGSGKLSASSMRVVTGAAAIGGVGLLASTPRLVIPALAPVAGRGSLFSSGFSMQPLVMPLQLSVQANAYRAAMADHTISSGINPPVFTVFK